MLGLTLPGRRCVGLIARIACLAAFPSWTDAASDAPGPNLLRRDPADKTVLVVPQQPDLFTKLAASDLARHIEQATGVKPETSHWGDGTKERLASGGNLAVLGTLKNNGLLEQLAAIVGSGAVDQGIDAAPARVDVRDPLVDRDRVGDVAASDSGLAAGGVCRAAGALGVGFAGAVAHRHAPSGAGQVDGDRAADSSHAAGYRGYSGFGHGSLTVRAELQRLSRD